MKNTTAKNSSYTKHLHKTRKHVASPSHAKYIGKKRETPVDFSMVYYNETEVVERKLKKLSEALEFKDKAGVTWLNINGLHDDRIIQEIGDIFKIHPLVLASATNTTQRPKIEEYDGYLFLLLKMAYYNAESHEVTLEQINLLIGNGYVVSLQEKESEITKELRERIIAGKGKIRKSGPDHLMYAIIDSVVDHYYSVLENIGEEIESMEKTLLLSASQEILAKIYSLKQELMYLRKSIWPMRELVNSLLHSEYALIKKETLVYLRDVYGNTIQIVETVETFRDMTSGMLDLYLSTISYKMNEVMKVLTIFTAIFIPLTFLAGVYGMNFEFMPEIGMKIAYPIWWITTITIALCMAAYFKKKKWL
jgi:magnesium transporter